MHNYNNSFNTRENKHCMKDIEKHDQKIRKCSYHYPLMTVKKFEIKRLKVEYSYVVANLLNCFIVVDSSEHKSRYYVHFQIDTL